MYWDLVGRDMKVGKSLGLLWNGCMVNIQRVLRVRYMGGNFDLQVIGSQGRFGVMGVQFGCFLGVVESFLGVGIEVGDFWGIVVVVYWGIV